MRPSSEELKQEMLIKSDEELYDIVHLHSGDYTAEALELAREQLAVRNLPADTVEELSTAGANLLKKEQEPLSWSLRLVAFFFSTVFFGIPVLLAHRHYVEKGEKRKAREWGRWGLLGAGFYFAIIFVRLVINIILR
ncbi:MAG TPA: hypothetical protein VMT67_12930 [Terriglobales bacterium]|nr:hypothetical protein [Terriglobales bacterium]